MENLSKQTKKPLPKTTEKQNETPTTGTRVEAGVIRMCWLCQPVSFQPLRKGLLLLSALWWFVQGLHSGLVYTSAS